MSKFERTELLLGSEAMQSLAKAKVLVFGVGGVGGSVVETLARTGIGQIDLCDGDTVSESNINRQLIATTFTVGKLKVEVEKERILAINPNCVVNTFPIFVNENNVNDFNFDDYDYIVDAIDMVSAKIAIAVKAQAENVMIISAMGAGNKLNPMGFKIADLNQTKVCPLAKVMRYELKKRGITHLKCAYSEEQPVELQHQAINPQTQKPIPASIAFAPVAMGLLIGSEVISDLIKKFK